VTVASLGVAAAALEDVDFALDRAAIRPEDAPALDANAHWLKANPGVLVLVEGHADERGSDAHNLTLGERRAKAARDALVARGVAPTRSTASSVPPAPSAWTRAGRRIAGRTSS
jgi:peptidoglycan-associated lipoprotein